MTEPRQTGGDFSAGNAFQPWLASPEKLDAELNADTLDKSSSPQVHPEIHNYFQAVPLLNKLRSLASQAAGPSACDLIDLLNREGLKAGFEPVGAFHQGITTESFFQGNPHFQEMEAQLARKISPENVSEIMELIKEADHYKPSGTVLGAIQETYLRLIALNTAPSPRDDSKDPP